MNKSISKYVTADGILKSGLLWSSAVITLVLLPWAALLCLSWERNLLANASRLTDEWKDGPHSKRSENGVSEGNGPPHNPSRTGPDNANNTLRNILLSPDSHKKPVISNEERLTESQNGDVLGSSIQGILPTSNHLRIQETLRDGIQLVQGVSGDPTLTSDGAGSFQRWISENKVLLARPLTDLDHEDINRIQPDKISTPGNVVNVDVIKKPSDLLRDDKRTASILGRDLLADEENKEVDHSSGNEIEEPLIPHGREPISNESLVNKEFSPLQRINVTATPRAKKYQESNMSANYKDTGKNYTLNSPDVARNLPSKRMFSFDRGGLIDSVYQPHRLSKFPFLSISINMGHKTRPVFLCPHSTGVLGDDMFGFASALWFATSKKMRLLLPDESILRKVFKMGDNFRGPGKVCATSHLLTSDPGAENHFQKDVNYRLGPGFRAWRHFAHINDKLRCHFAFKDHIKKQADNIIRQVRRRYFSNKISPAFIGIHLEMKTLPKFAAQKFDPMTSGFLRRAMEHFDSLHPYPAYIISTNDPKIVHVSWIRLKKKGRKNSNGLKVNRNRFNNRDHYSKWLTEILKRLVGIGLTSGRDITGMKNDTRGRNSKDKIGDTSLSRTPINKDLLWLSRKNTFFSPAETEETAHFDRMKDQVGGKSGSVAEKLKRDLRRIFQPRARRHLTTPKASNISGQVGTSSIADHNFHSQTSEHDRTRFMGTRNPVLTAQQDSSESSNRKTGMTGGLKRGDNGKKVPVLRTNPPENEEAPKFTPPAGIPRESIRLDLLSAITALSGLPNYETNKDEVGDPSVQELFTSLYQNPSSDPQPGIGFPKLRVVHVLPPLDPAVALAVLSHCNHSIVTSGSPSWWAAFLARGKTIYPQYRAVTESGNVNEADDYFPPSWHSMW